MKSKETPARRAYDAADLAGLRRQGGPVIVTTLAALLSSGQGGDLPTNKDLVKGGDLPPATKRVRP